MSEKGFQNEMGEEVNETSMDNRLNRDRNEARPVVLHLVPCPECGKELLDLIDSGIVTRSPILGITSDGEIGCSRTELEGDYELGIYCRSCGHQVCSDFSLANECGDEFLSGWAKAATEARPVLPSVCSKCDSQELYQVEVGIEFSHAVLAVCESNAPGSAPLIAVSHQRETGGRGTYRYRCSQGHELVKEDGTLVETVEDLVDWLKAHASGEKK
jgi:hypothetical protein